jgi:hypothetical protein
MTPKQIVTAGTKTIKKQRRPRERWTDECEDDLNINGNQKLVQSGQRAERIEEKCNRSKV